MIWLKWIALAAIMTGLVYFGLGGLMLAPWLPIRRRDRERVKKLASLQPGRKFYELGSGAGGSIFGLTGTGAALVGIELNPLLFLVAYLRSLKLPLSKRPHFKCGDLYRIDLSNADTVYFFGMPKTMDRIKAKLENELRPGTRVISYAFCVPGWVETARDKPSENDLPIYLYIME
jgi:hypothetical protein